MQKGIIAAIAGAAFALVLCCGTVAAQTRTIYINDNHGDQAIGTVIGGNFFFHDNRGNIAIGTIRDGNVFLNSNSGETLFGTVKNGNVFLTDRSGITTGTIQNGNIFLNNSDGSITTGIYDSSGHFQTSTTAPTAAPTAVSTTTQQQIDARNQAEYNAGYAMGQAAGSIILASIEHLRLKAFCKKNPTAVYLNNNSYLSGTPCPDAPLSQSEQETIDLFCEYNPGRDASIRKYEGKCVTPPAEPNLKWAEWEMDGLRRDYQAQAAVHSPGMAQAAVDWAIWRGTYCQLAAAKGKYKGLDGKKQHCH